MWTTVHTGPAARSALSVACRRTRGYTFAEMGPRTARRAVAAILTCGLLLACNALLDNAERDLRPADLTGEGGATIDHAVPSDSPVTVDGTVPCTDVMTDAKNCGRCGHDCLGGACTTGQCQPFEFAQVQAPQQVFVVGGAVYFSDGKGAGGINWCPDTGCGTGPSRISVSTGGFGLAVDSLGVGAISMVLGKVYEVALRFADENKGGVLTTRATGVSAVGLTMEPGFLYFTGTDGNAYRCARGTGCGSAPTRIALGVSKGGSIAVDVDNVYFASDGTGGGQCAGGCLLGAAKGATDATTTPTSFGRLPRTLHVDGDLFWTGIGGPYNGEVSRRDAGLGGSEYFYERDAGDVWGLTTDATNVYFTLPGAATIRYAPRNAAENESVVLVTGQKQPFGIAVDAKAIYWANYGGAAIMKLAR